MSLKVQVPADVPKKKQKEFARNYNAITKNSGRLMLFAGDQKIEHLNQDFYGKGISEDDADPEHLFRIASRAKIGAFASQLGLIARYAKGYSSINYIVKLNSKTNLISKRIQDPKSFALWTISQVMELKKGSKLKIRGIGYTLYLGSRYEAEMLREASQLIFEAHKNGLVAILWIYPRGSSVKDEKSADVIAGAAGVASCLGADFVKLSFPKGTFKESALKLRQAVLAAGNCKLVCAGGKRVSEKEFLARLYYQLHVAGAAGNATGRNIHQKDLPDAIRFCNAIYAVTVENKPVQEALSLLKAPI